MEAAWGATARGKPDCGSSYWLGPLRSLCLQPVRILTHLGRLRFEVDVGALLHVGRLGNWQHRLRAAALLVVFLRAGADNVDEQVGLVVLGLDVLQPGLEKTRFFLNPAQWVSLGFLGFFWVIMFFWGFLYICPEERVFRVFSVSRILLGASRL